MLFIPEPKHRRRRGAWKPPPTPPVASGPVLVAASFDAGDALLDLTFDRAVDVAAFNGTFVIVEDFVAEEQYDGTGGATLLDPVTVRVALVLQGATDVGTDVLLTASGATGIVAADGGAAWLGVTNLNLPFP